MKLFAESNLWLCLYNLLFTSARLCVHLKKLNKVYNMYCSHSNTNLNFCNCTGLFRTKKTMDREELPICLLKDPCVFNISINIKVTTADAVELLLYTLRIHLQDINDHVPQFSPDSIEKQVSETRTMGSLLDIPSATDADSPAYGIHRWGDTAILKVFFCIFIH